MNILPSFKSRVMNIIPASKPTELEKQISKSLQLKPVPTEVKKFANGETYVNIKSKQLRNTDVYIMPNTGNDVNDNLMETYLKAYAAKNMGASKVIAVLPDFPYGRQERKTEFGEPISAGLNIALLKASGVDEVITSDLHAPAVQGFSNDMIITEVSSVGAMVEYFKDNHPDIKDFVVVSPDLGGAKRADKFAKMAGCDKAIIYKNRTEHNKAIAELLIGDVLDRNCIIFDDIIDTAGTITEAVKMLKNNGAKDIYVCASHGLFNGDAISKLEKADIKEIIVSNSEKKPDYQKVKQVDLSKAIVGSMLDISA